MKKILIITTILLAFTCFAFSAQGTQTQNQPTPAPTPAVQQQPAAEQPATEEAQESSGPGFGSHQIFLKINFPLGDKGGVITDPIPGLDGTTKENIGFLSIAWAFCPNKQPGFNMGFQFSFTYVNGKDLSYKNDEGGGAYMQYDIAMKYLRLEGYFIAHYMFDFGLELGGGLGFAYTMNKAEFNREHFNGAIFDDWSSATEWSPAFSMPLLIFAKMNLIRWLTFGIQFKWYFARFKKNVSGTTPQLKFYATPQVAFEVMLGVQL